MRAHVHKVSPALASMMDLASHARLYVVHSPGPTHLVLSDDLDRQHRVRLGETHTCTCRGPKVPGSGLCLHILFVLLRVFRVPRSSRLAWQSGLVDREIGELMSGRARSLGRRRDRAGEQHQGSREQQQEVAAARMCHPLNGLLPPDCPGVPLVGKVSARIPEGNRWISGPRAGSNNNNNDRNANGGGGGGGGDDDDDDECCPICQDPLRDPATLVHCSTGCGGLSHRACMRKWVSHSEKRGDAATCPLCRAKWGCTMCLTVPDAVVRRFILRSGGGSGSAAAGGGVGSGASHSSSAVLAPRCSSCSAPARGTLQQPSPMFRCQTCAEYMLCTACYAESDVHADHPFESSAAPGAPWIDADPLERELALALAASEMESSSSSSHPTQEPILNHPPPPQQPQPPTTQSQSQSPAVLPEDVLRDLQTRDITPADYDTLLLLAGESNGAPSLTRALIDEHLPAPSPATTRDADTACPICMDPLLGGPGPDPGEPEDSNSGSSDNSDNGNAPPLVRTLGCGHSFHDNCVVQWLISGRNACPVDNMPAIDPDAVRRQQGHHAAPQRAGRLTRRASASSLVAPSSSSSTTSSLLGMGITNTGSSGARRQRQRPRSQLRSTTARSHRNTASHHREEEPSTEPLSLGIGPGTGGIVLGGDHHRQRGPSLVRRRPGAPTMMMASSASAPDLGFPHHPSSAAASLVVSAVGVDPQGATPQGQGRSPPSQVTGARRRPMHPPTTTTTTSSFSSSTSTSRAPASLEPSSSHFDLGVNTTTTTSSSSNSRSATGRRRPPQAPQPLAGGGTASSIPSQTQLGLSLSLSVGGETQGERGSTARNTSSKGRIARGKAPIAPSGTAGANTSATAEIVSPLSLGGGIASRPSSSRGSARGTGRVHKGRTFV